MRVIVMGAGIAGLSTALALGRRGRQVLVLERDKNPPPTEPQRAFGEWRRAGVGQFCQPHAILGAGRRVLRHHASDVYARLLEAGAGEIDSAALLTGPRAPEDEDLTAVACRRPVFEAVLRAAAAAEPTVQIATGAQARGLIVERDRNGSLHVRGVRLGAAGLEADLVVDALGRGSRGMAWLSRAGVELPPTLTSDCGLVYYSRHFRLRPGQSIAGGQYILGGPRGDLGRVAFAIFVGDNETFCVALMINARDEELKGLRRPDSFMTMAASLPHVARWIDVEVAEPISDVLPMGQLRNLFRPLANSRRPVLDGYRPIGDAWIHTNPTFAFGASLALTHAFSLAALLDEHNEAAAASEAFEALHAADARQRWASVTSEDRDRRRRWSGEIIDPLDPASSMPLFLRSVLYPAAAHDPEILRRVARRIHALDPIDALEQDGGLLDRARRIHSALTASRQAPPEEQRDRRALVGTVTTTLEPTRQHGRGN